MGKVAKAVLVAVSAVSVVAVNGAARVSHAEDIPAVNPLSGDEVAIKKGRSWYRGVCAVCHGGRADGAGERGQGADLRVFSKGFRRFVETVKNGKDTGRTMKMPAWGRVLSEQQIYQIGAYLETLALEG